MKHSFSFYTVHAHFLLLNSVFLSYNIDNSLHDNIQRFTFHTFLCLFPKIAKLHLGSVVSSHPGEFRSSQPRVRRLVRATLTRA